MRVIGGTARGTKLQPVPGDGTRPILDRVKTSLFDILRPELAGAKFLDLFAGSGSVGIEALSQGAQQAVFCDLSQQAVETIKRNLKATHLEDRSQTKNRDAFSFLKNTQSAFDIIYIAPPQYEGLWLEALLIVAERPDLLLPNARVIVQIDPKEEEPVDLVSLELEDRRKYGNTLLLFFRKMPKEVSAKPDQ
ncbi:MAG: 16S rRNA (guanine(966)-N(2))-methyltransferase RsmD [Bdellovibrionales bacterium]|nr:16S rRNA (guanine(966)-N(2))-methyltransferase RsmD [Bdellovibrionales bacterium]